MTQVSDIWLQLSSENVGFYLYRDRESIESLPGVYAWYNPLECADDSLLALVSDSRMLSCYDAKKKTTAHWRSKDARFNWEPFEVKIKKVAVLQTNEQEKINELESATDELEFARRQLLLAGTIFTQPLYIGLTLDLERRYCEHIADSEKNSFNKRFNSYCKEQEIQLPVMDLLFVCLYVRIAFEGNKF